MIIEILQEDKVNLAGHNFFLQGFIMIPDESVRKSWRKTICLAGQNCFWVDGWGVIEWVGKKNLLCVVCLCVWLLVCAFNRAGIVYRSAPFSLDRL